MRILFLHGYSQNGDVFRARTGALRKALKNDEIVYLSAPHPVTSLPTNFSTDAEVPNPRAWFVERRQVPTEEGESLSVAGFTYVGWQSSLEYLSSFLQEQSPFDGVLGFSQGATFAAIISTILSRPPQDQPSCFQRKASSDNGITTSVHPSFRFSILVSGFLPREGNMFDFAPSASIADSTRLNTQRTDYLFVVGERDALIPPERTFALMRTRYFERLKVQDEHSVRLLTHAGGHLIPTDAINRRAIVDFIGQHGVNPSL